MDETMKMRVIYVKMPWI